LRVHQLSHSSHDGEVETNNRGGGERVDHATLENQVDIHQAVAEDGVTEGQRQQGQ